MWWLLGLLIILLAAWGAASAHHVLYPPRVPISPLVPPPPSTCHALTAPDGVPFNVWVFEPSAPPRARLLLYHGYFANRNQVLGLADGLRLRGYEVVLPELRGHGERSGPCTLGIRETEEASVLLAWGRRRDHARPLPIGVVGFSMGAAVACQIAARYPEIRAVVADSIYSRFFPMLQRAIKHRYHLPPVPWVWVTWWTLQVALGHRLRRLDPASLAPQLHQPLLAIQGGEDRRVVPMLGREFYRRWAGPKERWFEPTVAHVQMFATHPQEYRDRVASFFDRTLT